jgi:hypothetical protein
MEQVGYDKGKVKGQPLMVWTRWNEWRVVQKVSIENLLWRGRYFDVDGECVGGDVHVLEVREFGEKMEKVDSELMDVIREVLRRIYATTDTSAG